MPRNPAKPQDRSDKLARIVNFRLTHADHAAYLEKVKASGMKPSVFFRDCVLTNRTQVVARPVANPDKTRLLFLANKASNNINQLAHRANLEHQAGTIGEATYSAILFELQALNQFLKATAQDAD